MRFPVSCMPTISAKSLGTLATLFRLFDQHPLNAVLIYTRYARSAQVDLPAVNSQESKPLT